MDIPKDEYERIAALIESDASPVGIDAKKTHIIILHKLSELERRLDRIEARLPPAEENARPNPG
ncbi:MAG: hypothetical protein IH986_06670 [Planctomycetes bacterium]|nr:hypothetical protein [Planctomycetota bacterium]